MVVSDYKVKGVLIKLSDDDLAQAKAVGDGRNAANAGSKDKPYYDRSRMEPDDIASFAAAAAECAVARALNKKWHAKVWPAHEHWLHKNEPDVGENIEVRRLRFPHRPLAVRQKDLGQNKFLVLAYPIPETGYRFVDVIGWIDADEAWRIGTDSWAQTRDVPQSMLNSMVEES